MPVFLRFYQTYYNAVRVELTTRTAHVAIRMIVTVTDGGGKPTGAGRGPCCRGEKVGLVDWHMLGGPVSQLHAWWSSKRTRLPAAVHQFRSRGGLVSWPVGLTGTCLTGPCPSSMLGGAARGHVYQQQCTSSGLVVVWSEGEKRIRFDAVGIDGPCLSCRF